MVSDLIDLGLFPGSDHNAILWKLEAATTCDQVSRQILDYSKADVKAIKQELKSVNWQNLFENLSADQSWAVFKDKLENLQWKYIPVKGRLNKRRKPMWMSNKALKAVRHRRQIYRKYKDTKHPAYVKAAK